MPKRKPAADSLPLATDLRIIGGAFRGRKLRYEPFQIGDDPVTRPMKHRVREAIFNLVGTEVEGRHAIDLFAGTGALGLEALSRGAARATFIERHVPTSRIIQENIAELEVESRATLLTASAFVWAKRDISSTRVGEGVSEDGVAWLVFCSPPYDFFVERSEEMLDVISRVMDASPPSSILVVEADGRFEFSAMPLRSASSDIESPWDVRTYPPAVVGVWRKPS